MAGGPGIQMTVSGVDDLLSAFDQLGKIGARAAMQDAMKKGAELTAEAARRLAPRGEDPTTKRRLADSIAVRANLSRSQNRKRGARRGEAEIFVGSTAPHAHLVEFGHMNVKVTRADEATQRTFTRRVKQKGGGFSLVTVRGKLARQVTSRRVVGHVPAHPFMRPAFDATKAAATKVIFEEFGRSLVKVAQRYGRQAASGKLTRGSRMAFRMELGL